MATRYDAKLESLEKSAKEEALKEIAELFQRPENLEKLNETRQRFEKIRSTTDSQLKQAMHTQLSGVRLGLTKLESALTEAAQIREGMQIIVSQLRQINGLSTNLQELKKHCEHYNNLDATMNHMKQITLIPNQMEKALCCSDSELLECHKILQGLEGMRNEIMMDIFMHDPNSAHLKIIEDFFKNDIDCVNRKIFSSVSRFGNQLLGAALGHSVLLVSCVRVIDREERADQVWRDRQKAHGFLPPGRPKQWKSKFFAALRDNIRKCVNEDAMVPDSAEPPLVKHLEVIRLHSIKELQIAQNICPPYFPPDYEIFNSIFKIYHEELQAFAQHTADGQLGSDEIFQFLGWINSYSSQEFMGQFEVDFEALQLEHPKTLLSAQTLDKLKDRFVDEKISKIRAWEKKSLEQVIVDWKKSENPKFDGNGYFYTYLSSQLLTPIMEMTTTNVLLYAGELVRDEMYRRFIRELIIFTNNYENALKAYRNEYYTNRNLIPKYIEYIVANSNDCENISIRISELIRKQYENNPQIMASLSEPLAEVTRRLDQIRDLCLSYGAEVIMVDANSVLVNFMTKDWIVGNDSTVDYLVGTFEDYRENTLIHIKDLYQKTIWADVANKLCVKYVSALLSKKLILNTQAERSLLQKRLNSESHNLVKYFTDIGVEPKSTDCYKSLRFISQIISADLMMISLDIQNMQKQFPEISREQIQQILQLRGDMKAQDIKEMATECTKKTFKETSGFFLDVSKVTT